MKIKYKLLTQEDTSFNSCQWTLDEWKEVPGEGELCTEGWLHCYTSPLLAILLNPVHARIQNPLLYKCEVDGKSKEDLGLKEGWSRMRIVEKLEVPRPTKSQRIAFGILCALEVCKEEGFVSWANKWLSGEDRTKKSTMSVDPSDYAACFAIDSVYGSREDVNTDVAEAAESATVDSVSPLDLIALAEKAMKYK